VVIAGLLIGNTGRHYAMSERTREHLDTFWELVDEILNVVLFVLIGLEVLVVELAPIDLAVALALSLPAEIAARDLIVTVTYAVVVFSILVQGLTIGRLVRWIPGQ
jgi:CPA1 family monovalent cation:H+ antiporter